jgi:hypothetical protein
VSAAASLTIAQVTPYPLESDHPVGAHVLRLADELAAAGHRIVVLAPSRDRGLVAQARRDLQADPLGVVPEPGGAPRVLAVGEAWVAGIGFTGADRAPALAVDAARTVEEIFDAVPFDLVHVHEPFGPSVSTAALRHSRSLNVGTFHLPAERFIAGMGAGPAIGRKRSERLLGRLDDRLAASAATASLVARSFPFGRGYGHRVPPPAVDRPAATGEDPGAPVHVVVPLDEERAARRVALRALRRLDPALPWRATVVVPDDGVVGSAAGVGIGAALRDRVTFTTTLDLPADADVVLLASTGARPAPHRLVEALGLGAIPLASRIDVHEELTDGGRRGPLFEPGDLEVLVQQLTTLVTDPDERARRRAAAAQDPVTGDWPAYAAWVQERYATLRGRRHDPQRFGAELLEELRTRPRIDIDLHMHTDHSSDCATPVEVLLDTARRQGLGAIVVTDHNEVSGAFEAQAKAAEFGVQVIVGEEVKTADQGEVIGIFLKERIPKGVTLQEAIADIRRQGGLVYVPHPFDRMHSVPDYEHLLDVVDEVDAIEVFNPRVAIGSFNEEARRFAEKYRIVAGAGSDSHVAQGLGSVRVRVPRFDGPEEFLAALSLAEISTKPGTLVYVQALKFLETKATPPKARKRVRDRRVRRATGG